MSFDLAAQALDLLMALILVMFVPIGLWRGALREWIALGGIVLGSALAAEWGYSWGADLAAGGAFEPHVARFAVGALLFLAVTLLVGYGAGLALPFRPDLSWPNRLLGATLGAGNGLLILSGALRIMQRSLFDDATTSPLRSSALARFLIDDIGWALLLLTLTLIVSVGVGAVRRWRGQPSFLEEYAPLMPGSFWQQNARDEEPVAEIDEDLIPPELVNNAGGVPSWRGQRIAPRNALAEQQTAVLRPVTPPVVVREIVEVRPDDQDTDPPSPPATPQPAIPGTGRRVIELARPVPNREVVALPPRGTNGGDEALPNGPGPAASPQPSASPPLDPTVDDDAPTLPPIRRVPVAASGPPSVAQPLLAPASAQSACVVCGASVAARAHFCHVCGHILGNAERRRIQNA